MYQLLESIKCNGGKLQNLPYHQARVNQSFHELFPTDTPPNLSQIRVPQNLQGIYKCRFLYGRSHSRYHFVQYKIRTIHTLQCVVSNVITYQYKYLDRTEINKLSSPINDQEIVIIRDGLITDSSYANLAFFDGVAWYTPSSYLLKGTKRQLLLDQEKLTETEIRVQDIHRYQQVSLINALLDLGQISLPIDRILL